MTLIWISIAVIVVFAAYVRVAPSDSARWHKMPDSVAEKDFAGGAMRVVADADKNALQQLDAIARAWPRTRVLTGAVDEGMITYVTRTALWGFPDYTTVRLNDAQLELYGRLRFGRRDMGVNRARLEAWLRQL